MTYQPESIETAIQQQWEDRAHYHVEENAKEKFYCLSMLPYPSGQLHMGHVRNYTIGDVISRYQRLLGKNVLQPMGWDAFGLPAENAAIKHNVPPAEWTKQNIDHMCIQLKRLGFSYDWQREVDTSQPDYYRWEQWLFIQMYKKGLAYKKNAWVNWDPVDQTVLANEQVVDGRGWRSGALVERKAITQWFLKITDYAEELLNDIDKLTGWPEQVRTMQRKWIGRAQGVMVDFAVMDHATILSTFTTRADTLFGVTFISIALQHSLAQLSAQNNPKIAEFISQYQSGSVAEAAMATQEKRGIFSGFYALHPITNQQIPIWIGNYVIMDYGTGAVMGVPAHDSRDFEFAKYYQLPIKIAVKPPQANWDFSQAAYVEDEGSLVDAQQFNDLNPAQARQHIAEYLQSIKKGQTHIQYRLRDWGISRQRYWGTPIPMINCKSCGTVPVAEQDLPVVLPTNVEFSGTKSPLKTIPEFYQTTCPQCHQPAQRETDTFDTFVESSWYFARYTCWDQNQAMFDERVNHWLPVDHYIGGIEHAVMHLLYARFFYKVLRDFGLVKHSEPFTRLLTQGMVLKDGSKMSKSKGNTVDPQTFIEKYGADTIRLFIMFAAPPEQSLEWSDSGVEGAQRFLRKLWTISQQIKQNDFHPVTINNDARRQIYEVLQKVNFDYERQQFNTVVSGAMKILNLINESELAVAKEGLSILLRILFPITPHICWHLYPEIETAFWPKVDNSALISASQKLIVQINGKRRGEITVANGANQAMIEQKIKQEATLQNYFKNKKIDKIIIVPKKLVNVVISDA